MTRRVVVVLATVLLAGCGGHENAPRGLSDAQRRAGLAAAITILRCPGLSDTEASVRRYVLAVDTLVHLNAEMPDALLNSKMRVRDAVEGAVVANRADGCTTASRDLEVSARRHPASP